MGFKSFKSYGYQKTNLVVELISRPLPIFNYFLDSSLLLNSATGNDDATNTSVVLDNQVFKYGGGSAKFIGNNSVSYINTPKFTLQPDTGFSFSCWFKVPAGTLKGFQPIFSTNNASQPSLVFGQDYQNPNCMFFYGTDSRNAATINIFYTIPVFDDTWHHSVVVISADGLTTKWFLDGSQINYSTRTPSSYPFIEEVSFQIGCPVGFTGSFNVDNFIMFDTPISDDDVRFLYNTSN